MESVNSLDQALADLDTQVEGSYVFATSASIPPGLEPFATIQEAEGITLIVRADQAEQFGLGTGELFARLTPTAVTQLDAVGITATIAQTLASRGIPCNVIAGYYHDHFFVPADKAQEALALLRSLSTHAQGWLGK